MDSVNPPENSTPAWADIIRPTQRREARTIDTLSKSNLARVSGLLLAGVTLLLAALLIIQCLGIYQAGNAPENLTESGVRINDTYSRELVAQRLSGIAWAFWLWLAALVFAIVCRAVHPQGEAASKMDAKTRLEIVKARVEATPEMQAEEKKRRLATILLCAICLACASMCAIYLLDIRNFTSKDLESVIGAMLLHIGPWVLIALACLVAYYIYADGSFLREAELAKGASKKEAGPANETSPQAKSKGVLRIALYLAAIALVVAGILNGGMYDVLVKAVNICTECVGLG